MKSLFSSVVFLLLSIMTFAHIGHQSECIKAADNGLIVINWTLVPLTYDSVSHGQHFTKPNYVHITYSETIAGHLYKLDTIIAVTSNNPFITKFPATNPFMRNSGEDVKFEFKDGWSYTIPNIVYAPPCALPVTFGAFAVIKTGDGTYTSRWTTEMESNADRFIVQGANDDSNNWTDLAIVKSHWQNGNSAIAYTYSVSMDTSTGITYAGSKYLYLLMLGISIFAFIGKTKIGKVGILIVSMVLIFSCSKTNVKKDTPAKNYSYFRILEVDLDGNQMNSKIVIVNQ